MPSSPALNSAGAEVASVPPGALEGLAGDWHELWQRCPDATPFQSPAWLLPWSRHFAPGRAAAVSLRLDGRLAGLLPVFCWEEAMLLAGTGPSDRGDLLLEPGLEAHVPALVSALPRLRCGPWTRIDFRQLPPASPLLGSPVPAGWSREERPDEPCLVAPLAGPDGLANASPRRRSNWRYAMRRLEREGGTTGLVPPSDVPEAVEDLIRLHNLRWERRGEPGVFADSLLCAFLREAGPTLAGSGLLRLHELRFGPERAALLLILAGTQAHHYYIGGFDPTREKLSPSAALVGAAMTRAHREGAAALDFLRGAEPYKRHWGAAPCETRRLRLRPA